MILKYKLKENDFLQYSLYFFKELNSLKKIIIKTLAFWLVIHLIIIVTLFLNNLNFLSIIICLVAIISLIINPSRIKGNYLKKIKKNSSIYSNRTGRLLILEINDNCIKITGDESESKINISAVDKIIETNQHFFIRLNPEAIIIPKAEIESQNFVKTELMTLAENQKIAF